VTFGGHSGTLAQARVLGSEILAVAAVLSLSLRDWPAMFPSLSGTRWPDERAAIACYNAVYPRFAVVAKRLSRPPRLTRDRRRRMIDGHQRSVGTGDWRRARFRLPGGEGGQV
jgi:hypothetical protein